MRDIRWKNFSLIHFNSDSILLCIKHSHVNYNMVFVAYTQALAHERMCVSKKEVNSKNNGHKQNTQWNWTKLKKKKKMFNSKFGANIFVRSESKFRNIEDWPSRRHWITYHHRNDSFEYRNDLVECCSLRFLIFSLFFIFFFFAPVVEVRVRRNGSASTSQIEYIQFTTSARLHHAYTHT